MHKAYGSRISALVLILGLTAPILLFAPSANVQAQSCYVNGAFGLDFGSVSVRGSAASSAIRFTCAPDYATGATYYYQVCIYLNPGQWSAGQPTRRMSDYNGHFLNYDLFSDPAHTQIIGAPGSTPTFRLNAAVSPGTPKTTHAPIYGWVYPGQAVPAAHIFQEQGTQGLLRYRFSTTGYPSTTEDCTAGGMGGATSEFSSSGVVATFENSCWIVATDLEFGSTPAPQREIRSEATIRVNCPPGTTWRVGLSNGQNADGASRRMAGVGGFVRYQLYRDSAHAEVWGDDEESQASGSTGAHGATELLTVYGAIPAQSSVGLGLYADTIVATLYY